MKGVGFQCFRNGLESKIRNSLVKRMPRENIISLSWT